MKRHFYGDFIINSDEELDLMRTNEWSKQCPTWFVEAFDAYGNRMPMQGSVALTGFVPDG